MGNVSLYFWKFEFELQVIFLLTHLKFIICLNFWTYFLSWTLSLPSESLCELSVIPASTRGGHGGKEQKGHLQVSLQFHVRPEWQIHGLKTKSPSGRHHSILQITDDYNTLLKQATDEIKALTKAREQDCHQSGATAQVRKDMTLS